MIGYTQLPNSPGLNAAMNGRTTDEHAAEFLQLRHSANIVSVQTASVLVGNITVQVGHGIIRIELDGREKGEQGNSPLALVFKISEVRQQLDSATANAIETAMVLGRDVSGVSIRAALVCALKLNRHRLQKWVIPTILIAAACVIFVITAAIS